MKFVLFVFLTALLVMLLNPFLAFWAVMLGIAILAAISNIKGTGAFFAGGLGMGLMWLGQTIYISTVSGSSLPDKIGGLMGVGNEFILFAFTGVLGFFLGAFSALCGSSFRKLLRRKPDNIYRQ
ncbi:hypothetical protein LZF95_11550 [Algoriphagus sp. AGSA1]|uniref:hypothetical protein n=1 Tax=Algoriphagus sp. AGSA1 TaxID=2907213 RepID=UPI001F19C814|nr:hypothetical protein [Algoriphagus sp. AGSA1]MCE7055312.1 hypothetical protein [Algoriphagus sp. AGSA1]